MKITHDHPASKYGMPVILDDDGSVMDYGAGIRAIRDRLDLSTRDIAAIVGGSPRTVEGWEQGFMPRAQALNALSLLLGPNSPAAALKGGDLQCPRLPAGTISNAAAGVAITYTHTKPTKKSK